MQKQFQRTVDAAASRAAEGDDLIEMSISSEAPYERFFGIEILRHTPESIDLSRLADGRHPLLLGHDHERQIGVVKRAWIDSEAKKLRGAVKFSRGALGQEIRQDVEDGIRSLISVGYFIEEIEEIGKAADGTETVLRTLSGEDFRREMEKEHGADFYRAGPAAVRAKGSTPPTFVVTRWQPFEVSVVPVPADVTVGIGRSAGAGNENPKPATKPLITLENRNMEQKTPAELEIERRDEIAKIGAQYVERGYITDKDIADAIRNGRSVDQFKDFIMEKMESRHTDVSHLHIGMTPKEVKRYSLGRALVAAVTGNWQAAQFELECSRAVEKIMGRSPEGFYVPFDAFHRDFNAGTSSEAGNLVATNLRTDLYTDALRNAMVMGRLGVRFLTGLSGNVDIPRKATAGTLGMLTEIGSASETAPVTAKATLSPKRIGAYVEVSKQALIQAAMSLEDMIRDDLLTGSGVLLENQCINGAGTGAEIRGLRNLSGIGTVVGGTNGAAPTWGHIVDLESACANANAEPDRTAGYLLNTKTRGKLKQTQLATNLPFIWQNGDQPLNGYRVAVTNNVPSNLTKGTSTTVCSAGLFSSDWSMTVIGLFGAPDVTVDPYTKADTGQVKITLNQFADMQHRLPATVSKIDDWLAN